ncbi:hypothetical protein C7377_0192 [Balneicella halophila]|uniref:Acyl-CoA:6-aminopenicillanic acid acyl transferase n=1 Tax=Balneicella halophila TaxID=1537566 RepID=A0A7L4UQ73_BALHA|nr:hypothetical protein [Balneicella halophila]PVX51900.1 hypothetical protein C7377_0192 [Balneicella halophila]
MKKLIIALLILMTSISVGLACTTAVISGKNTKDGRPIIWKLRDTESYKNDVRYFSDGKYAYVGLMDSRDTNGENVWGGTNNVGFSIMNSASFNVNEADTTDYKDQEGRFMKKALQQCETLEDLENLLVTLPRPMGLAAHFGVIDAKGGAAFYEVNNQTYTKFDANDLETAPNGYVIRTNYSKTGTKDVGYGYIRCQTAEMLFKEAAAKDNLNSQTIIQDFSRCMIHPVLKRDYRKEYSQKPMTDDFVNSDDLITRHGSASAVIIRGVRTDESPNLSTMWTMVGFPNTSLTLPVFPLVNTVPSVLAKDETGTAPLNRFSLALKDECYPIKPSSGYKYLKISKLYNAEGTGYAEILEKAEKEVFEKTESTLSKWRQNPPSNKEVKDFYDWLDSYTLSLYKNEFNLE